MRPFFPFYGSTWNRARHLTGPRYSHVVEPFAGGAGYSVFYDCRRVTLLDADPIVAGVWSYLLSVTPEEVMALPELPHVGDSVDNYRLPQEAKWLIGFWLNRGSAQPKKSRTAYSARTDRAQLNWGLRAKERIARQLPGIAGWSIACGDYRQAPDVEASWLIDPPYVDKGKHYRVGFAAHEELAHWARSRRGQVQVLEGPGADWLPFRYLGEFKTSTGKAGEYVWENEDANEVLAEFEALQAGRE